MGVIVGVLVLLLAVVELTDSKSNSSGSGSLTGVVEVATSGTRVVKPVDKATTPACKRNEKLSLEGKLHQVFKIARDILTK